MSQTGDDYFTILSHQTDTALSIIVDEEKPTFFFVVLHISMLEQNHHSQSLSVPAPGLSTTEAC